MSPNPRVFVDLQRNQLPTVSFPPLSKQQFQGTIFFKVNSLWLPGIWRWQILQPRFLALCHWVFEQPMLIWAMKKTKRLVVWYWGWNTTQKKWGLFHKPWNKNPVIFHQSGFHGVLSFQGFELCSSNLGLSEKLSSGWNPWTPFRTIGTSYINTYQRVHNFPSWR